MPTLAEDLTQVYRDPAGPRGGRRVSLTDNQKVVLSSLHEWEVFNNAPSRAYRLLRPAARRRAIHALYAKGLINDRHYVTDAGHSYAGRFRVV